MQRMQIPWKTVVVMLAVAGLPTQTLLAQSGGQADGRAGKVVRQCGRERWAQKILADDDTAMINFSSAALTSIQELAERPTVVADEFMPRQHFERNIYSVDALLCGYRIDGNGNFRLYLRDPSGNRTMPALIPDPNCPEIAATPHAGMYHAIRDWIQTSVGPAADSFPAPKLVAVTGVGLYEALNHEPWVAANRLALHPVIGLQPIESPRLTPKPILAAAQKKQKKGGTTARSISPATAATTATQQSPNQPTTQSVARKTEQKKTYRTGKRKKNKKFRRYRRAASQKRN